MNVTLCFYSFSTIQSTVNCTGVSVKSSYFNIAFKLLYETNLIEINNKNYKQVTQTQNYSYFHQNTIQDNI